MTWSSTPITMLLDRKVDSWTTSVGITLSTVHVSVVSVKLMPSVELDRQSQRRGYQSVMSLPFPNSLSPGYLHSFHWCNTLWDIAKWWLFCHRDPGTQSRPESPVSGESLIYSEELAAMLPATCSVVLLVPGVTGKRNRAQSNLFGPSWNTGFKVTTT